MVKCPKWQITSAEFMSLFLMCSLSFFFMVYLLWLFCPLAAAFSFYTCTHFSYFVFYGVFFMSFPIYHKWRWRKRVVEEKKVKGYRKRKFKLWLKSFQWLTINLVLFCFPDVRGGRIDLGVGFVQLASAKQSRIWYVFLCYAGDYVQYTFFTIPSY